MSIFKKVNVEENNDNDISWHEFSSSLTIKYSKEDGIIFGKRHWEKGNYIEAIQIFQILASLGVSEANYYLGLAYANGLYAGNQYDYAINGYKKDINMALSYYQLAADDEENPIPEACDELALYYRNINDSRYLHYQEKAYNIRKKNDLL